jgi:hypothetical protein
VIAAQQRELKLTPELVPQLLKLDRPQHVASVPQGRHHFAKSADWPPRLTGLADEGTDHLAELVAVDSAFGREAGHGRGRVEQDQRAVAACFRRIDSSSLQLGHKRVAVSLGGDRDRHAAGLNGAAQVPPNGRRELGLVLVEMDDMVIRIKREIFYRDRHPCLPVIRSPCEDTS